MCLWVFGRWQFTFVGSGFVQSELIVCLLCLFEVVNKSL